MKNRMFKLFKTAILASLVVLLPACKKSKTTVPPTSTNPIIKLDTVDISEYFPAYPGSWWEFPNGDSIVVDNDYHPFKYVDVNGDTLSALMPRLKQNWFIHVYNYEMTDYSYIDGLRISRGFNIDSYGYICDTVLNSKTIGGNRPNGPFFGNGYGKVVSINDTMQFQGKIYTHVVKLDINYEDYKNTAWFIEGIGLVRLTWSEQRGVDDGPWWTPDYGTYVLQSYFINR